jgi:hypothetical protein
VILLAIPSLVISQMWIMWLYKLAKFLGALVSWGGIQFLKEGYHITMNFTLSPQCTLGDGWEILSWNSIHVKA